MLTDGCPDPRHDRIAARLDAYADLHEVTGISTPTLLWLPTHRREAALRKLLRAVSVPAATASATLGRGPADAVWLAVGATDQMRRQLVVNRPLSCALARQDLCL